uniref:Uncharacterized protein n=1 Tax=Setaria viridis TaxID=4556 RepID=A0A4U6SRU9_SETVI|nr:hypothetical protein SEVIR_9G037500v2 [Setaria viridis]
MGTERGGIKRGAQPCLDRAREGPWPPPPPPHAVPCCLWRREQEGVDGWWEWMATVMCPPCFPCTLFLGHNHWVCLVRLGLAPCSKILERGPSSHVARLVCPSQSSAASEYLTCASTG